MALDDQISEPFLLPFLFDQVDPSPANGQAPIHCGLLPLTLLPLDQVQLRLLDGVDPHQLARHMAQLCLLHISLFHNVPDVDAGDGVDVDGGEAPVVLRLVGHLLLLLGLFLRLSVKIFFISIPIF